MLTGLRRKHLAKGLSYTELNLRLMVVILISMWIMHTRYVINYIRAKPSDTTGTNETLPLNLGNIRWCVTMLPCTVWQI